MPGFTHRPWEDFAQTSNVAKPNIALEDLVEMAAYKTPYRTRACNGTDPLEILPAYGQNNLIYHADNSIAPIDEQHYRATAIDDKVNKFTHAYRQSAPLLLHQKLADIVVDAAIDLYSNHHWKLRVYDGLRTMEAAYALYKAAKPEWLGYDKQGNKTLPALLSEPGASAHNRALAVDSSLVDKHGCEVERFDNVNMQVSHRNYMGDDISATQRSARWIKECAFQHAAFKNGVLLAPLRSEYWDDRMPGCEADLWRVMESLCRCLGIAAPQHKAHDYATFSQQWHALDKAALIHIFGEAAAHLPLYKDIIFHERFNPIYDSALPPYLRQC